eukprot:gene17567-biopygen2338
MRWVPNGGPCGCAAVDAALAAAAAAASRRVSCNSYKMAARASTHCAAARAGAALRYPHRLAQECSRFGRRWQAFGRSLADSGRTCPRHARAMPAPVSCSPRSVSPAGGNGRGHVPDASHNRFEGMD